MISGVGQQVESDLARAIEDQLFAELSVRNLEEVFELTTSHSKLAKLGLRYYLKVVSAHKDGAKGGPGVKNAEGVVEEKVIRWLSHEVSTRLTNNLVDFTIEKITKKHMESGATETIVDSDFSIQFPTWTEGVDFVVRLDGIEVASVKSKEVEVTGEFNGKVDADFLSTDPEVLEKVKFTDCGVTLEVKLPWGEKVSHNFSLKGELTV